MIDEFEMDELDLSPLFGEKIQSKIVMFDICKIYPIWIPPCNGDIWNDLTEALNEMAGSLNKMTVSVESISKSMAELGGATQKGLLAGLQGGIIDETE